MPAMALLLLLAVALLSSLAEAFVPLSSFKISCRSAQAKVHLSMVLADPPLGAATRSPSVPARLNWPGAKGWQFWQWRGNNIHFVASGDATDKPALVLIHGFGASAYHWRHQIPELSKKYRVYALDLLGFGLSDKPLESYTPDVWRDQVLDFVSEVVQGPAVLAGNSLGGYTALFASSESPESVRGCILLNAAGSFESEGGALKGTVVQTGAVAELVEKFKQWAQRAVLSASFHYTRQPQRITQVLKQVYSVDPSNVDEELVESIRYPSDHPNAAEVFYRVVTRNSRGGGKTIDALLSQLKVPLLLLWGEKDPWIRPAAADAIQALHPPAKRVSLDAGHCPQDEKPHEVNAAMLEWMAEIGY